MPRVHEIAKKYNLPSKDIIEILKKLNHPAKSHMSGIEDDIVPLLEKELDAAKGNNNKKLNNSTKEKKPNQNSESMIVETVIEEEKPKSTEKKVIDKEIIKKPNQVEEIVEEKTNQNNIIDLPFPLSVLNFSQAIAVPLNDIVLELMKLGEMLGANDLIQDKDITLLIAQEFGKELNIQDIKKDANQSSLNEETLNLDPVEEIENPYAYIYDEIVDVDKKILRGPVVTLMGHVDHGKTSILDHIRSARVAEKEAGGITQHIGAYDIEHQGSKIVFVDTPGHAAFTQMRAMGAKVTDIVILVVAADEGMKPQTHEAIDHAKAAEVPIIVAINKMDREGANPERIKKQLNEKGLVCEDWGGDIIVCELSAKTGQGMDQLLDMILLQAEIMELYSSFEGRAHGVILESRLSTGRGPTCTVLLQSGKLKIGDFIVAGSSFGKVKAMFDVTQKSVKQINPNIPAEVLGFNSVPNVGEKIISVETEKLARYISSFNQKIQDQLENSKGSSGVSDVFAKLDELNKKEIKIILKADTRGSIEALTHSLDSLDQEEVGIRFLVQSVGEVTDNDVTLAKASNAIIIAFHVKTGAKARDLAKKQGVQIRAYKIIYEVIEEIKALLKGEIAPQFEEQVIGHARIQRIYDISKHGRIAGCMVTDGIVRRKAGVKIIRDHIELFKGELASLKRFKDEVKEVREGFECGLSINNFNEIEENDILEFYESMQIEAVRS